MVRTHGLTHVALAVRDPKRSFEFYRRIFGVKAVYRDAASIQAQTPGARDVIVFERDAANAGRRGGIAHFGFRLQDPRDLAKAVRAVERAGGVIKRRGEFVPGEPYLFAEDPDGYELEIWFEIPTPVDPKPPVGGRRAPRTVKRAPRGRGSTS